MKKIILWCYITVNIFPSFAQAPKKVLVEEHTGIWCGFCPKAKTALEDCLNFHPNAVGVAMHASDVLSNSYTTAIANGFSIGAYPNGTVDRYAFITNYVLVPYTNWKSRTTTRLNTPTPVAVNFTSNYDTSTRVLNITATANFVGNASGDIRINCILTEDSIVKPNNPQTNYYGNGCSSADSNSVWYNYPCHIPNYVHNHVARINLANDNWGTAGVIPSSVTSGQSFSQNYSYTLPTTWNPHNMHIVVFVSKYGANIDQREILNTNTGHLINTSTEVIENNTIQQIEVKQNVPNPFKDITAIQFKLNTTDNVSLKIYNILGEEISTICNSKLIPGDHTFYWDGTDNMGNLVAGGVYYYTISSYSERVSKQMILIK